VLSTGSPVVTLRTAPNTPYDGAIAAARTCYSPRVIGTEEITDSQRDSIGTLTFDAGHHTVYQHAHFEFGLENISRQFVWTFLHSYPFYNSEQSSQRYVKLREPRAYVPPLSGAARDVYESAIVRAWDRYAELSALLKDDALAILKELRYVRPNTSPERLKLIDRMVADSRAIGLNHTAGLSGPQQIQMTLFALAGLLDTAGERKRIARDVVRTRYERLYRGAGLAPPRDPLLTHYYATIDIPALARGRYGAAFAEWLLASFEPIDFVVRLAEERGIVLLDGGGFDAPTMSVRVSLANLPDEAYEPIGRAIADLLADYHARFLRR